MERSSEIGNLVAALAKAQLEFIPALKENEGKIQGTSKTGNAYEYAYKYADLAANISAVRPALNKNGIALMQFPEVDLEHQTVSVMTALHHGEQFISQTFEAPATGRQGFNVQSIGATTTYLRRYGLQALCGLASEDDDGDSVATDNKPIAKPKAVPKVEGPTEADFQMWHEAFAECTTIDEWNKLIVPMMKERYNHPQYGKQFVVAAAEEAKKRGYVGDRASGNYKEKAAKTFATVEEYDAAHGVVSK